MYSQHNEEEYIIRHVDGVIGNFLDIGAYDGKSFSNTLRLAELGWGGICIEPSPSVFPSLLERFKDNPKIKTVNCAISDVTGKLKFYDSGGDAISTFSESHKAKWEKANVKFTEVEVDTITVKDMFNRYGYDFEFINLDVEDLNWNVFCQFPLDSLTKMRLICIEHDLHQFGIRSKLAGYGFKEIFQNDENIILGR